MFWWLNRKMVTGGKISVFFFCSSPESALNLYGAPTNEFSGHIEG